MVEESATFLSLFSGCGGLDLGFIRAGFRNVGAVDIDEAALTVHKKNISSPTFLADLSLAELPEGVPKRFDVLVAGSPCQGFSTIGHRRLDDPRNSLLLVPAKIASQLRPKIVIVENVPAVTSGQHGKYWRKLHRLLRSAGYKTTEVLCEASDFGVAQVRRRLLLIAWRKRGDVSLSINRAAPNLLDAALRGVDGLPNHDVELLKRDSRDYLIAKHVRQGQKLSNSRSGQSAIHTWDIPEVFGATTRAEKAALNEIIHLRRRARVRDYGDADPIETKVLRKLFGSQLVTSLVKKKYLRQLGTCHDLVGTFNGKYRRLRTDAAANTVDTRFGDPQCFLHPLQHRGFTVREAARIQGFSDDFIFHGTRKEQFRMIGNAVPPPMAEGVARMVKSAFHL